MDTVRVLPADDNFSVYLTRFVSASCLSLLSGASLCRVFSRQLPRLCQCECTSFLGVFGLGLLAKYAYQLYMYMLVISICVSS